MVETVRRLHREFAELIVGKAMTYWWYDGDWALQQLQISSVAKSAPAFFLANTTKIPDSPAPSDRRVQDFQLPFPSCWLAYRWEEDDIASSEFAYFERSGHALKLATYARGDNKESWSGKVYNFDFDTHLIGDLAPVEQKMIGKIFEVLDTVNQPIERVESPPSLLIRQRLAKGGVTPRNSRFINVYATRPKVGGLGEIGSPKSAHDRRGHWRTYKSGKRVWVRESAIHGGANSARSYAVLKA